MIPQRVRLAGFLSYQSEQDILFTGAPVWMLAGSNGSGKSSVFDAVTFALFGHHRGGGQNAVELINKDSNALSVEFDFTLDGQLYRIKRTLKRTKTGSGSGTQQIFRHAGSSLGNEGGWEAVPDTNKKTDFESWIHDKVGLTYETFTSSVLLLQGKAEKLLDSKPSGRAEVLAGIVDLERYQRLHENANGRKLILKGHLDSLGHQTAAVPDVSEMEYELARQAIETATENRDAVQVSVDALIEREVRARQWADATARLAAGREKLKTAEALLGEAVRIERAYARLRELKEVLPAVFNVATTRAKHLESERKTERILKEREQAQEAKAAAEAALDTAKKKRDALRKTLAADETKQTEVGRRLRELSAVLTSLSHVERQEAELKRLDVELKGFPADPAAEVEQATEEADRLAEVERVHPILDRLHTERTGLLRKQEERDAETVTAARVRAEGETTRKQHEAAKPELDRAKAARASADEAAAGAAVLVKQARDRLAEFESLTGAKECQACGQPLTPAHFASEKKRRANELAAAEKRAADANTQRDAAVRREQELTTTDAQRTEQLLRLREQWKEHSEGAKSATSAADQHLKYCKTAYAELPDAFRRKVSFAPPADWALVSYPARDQLSALKAEAAGLDAARRRQRDATRTLETWRQTKTRRESASTVLVQLKAGLPPGDPPALRGEHASLSAEETALVTRIKGTKASITAADSEVDRFTGQGHDAARTLTELTGRLLNEENVRKDCQERTEQAVRLLPIDWQLLVEKAGTTEYSRWKDEYETLVAKDTEGTHKRLEQSRAGLDSLRSDLRTLEADADVFPPDCRRPPDEVKVELASAKAALVAADKGLNDARRELSVLDGHRARRAELGEQFRKADVEHARYKALSELLGRERLQRHLVRKAERQIVDYANAVLDRLSGGQLLLKLIGGDDGAGTDRALDLECTNRTTGGSPINVAFLSGSQRFRVAVSLALGIGQYASRQHRPIESVIIDEGFGCLDRNGRQVMIQELQNLRGHLHCILLVSHQEEFAEAFADGYRFELADGGTKVTRFRR